METRIATPDRLFRIGHHLFQRRRSRDRFSVLHHAFDVKCEGFLSHGAASSRVVPAVINARKIRKGDAKVAVGLLMDKTNIVMHGAYLSFRPDCFSMLFSVPIGMSRSGWGTVTRPVSWDV